MTLSEAIQLDERFDTFKIVSTRKITLPFKQVEPTGRYPRERDDCTVRSMSLATDWPYAETHELQRRAGRPNYKPWLFMQWMPKILHTPINGVLFSEVFSAGECINGYWIPASKKMSLNRFVKSHSKGSFIVCVHGHALAVIDGVIHDKIYTSPLTRVWKAYKVDKMEKT